MEHHFVVTRDRNKEYHVCRQTSKVIDQSAKEQCIDISAFHNHEYSFPSIFAPNQRSCSANFSRNGNLTIASYNIWNVNKLAQKEDTYKSRMKRLSKVRIVHVN